ncbi:MAG: addiction module antidote protein, HigA family, partial [Desulfobacca sp. RBG_16_60_12]
RRPTPPGEILRHEFLEPLGLSQMRLAEALGITRVRLSEIIRGKRAITPFPEGLKQAIAWFKDNRDLIAAAARFGLGMSSVVCNLVSGG